jgi:DNA-binding IclR family transcriptional regulator
MKITALQEYGIRCLLQLAERGGDTPVRIRTIAEKEGISTDYVGKILTHLKKTGMVGYDHRELSIETVKMFYDDGQKVGYTLYES